MDITQVNLPWIHSPFFEQLLESSDLEDDLKKLVKHYAEYGYVIVDSEIPNFDRLSHEIIHNLASEYQGHGRIQDAWRFNQGVRTIATAPKITELLSILYQRDPIPFQTLNFRVGTQQKAHSDTIHFHSFPPLFMCGVWIALEDIDSNNGPVYYYPGSHNLPVFDGCDIGMKPSQDDYPLYEEFIEELVQAQNLKRVEVSLSRGQALIWAANLLHGGSPIRDMNRTRHTQVTHYYFSDCMYYTPMFSEPMLGKVHLREIINIKNQELVPNMYKGRKIEPNITSDPVENQNTSVKEPISTKMMTIPGLAKIFSRFRT